MQSEETRLVGGSDDPRVAAAGGVPEAGQFLEALLETIPLGIDIVDQQGRVLFLNKAMEALAGPAGLGVECWRLYRDDREQCAACPLRRPFEVGHTRTLEVSGVFGGRVFMVRHTGMRFRGSPVMLEVFEDMTERRRMEEAVRQSEERFRRLAEATLEGVAMHDHGRLTDANRALARMLGYEPAELIGKQFEELVAPESREAVAEHLRGGDEKPCEALLRRKDGSGFVAEINSRALHYNGRAAQVAAVRDITHRKQSETAFLRAQRLESLGTLAGGIAHDLNNALAPIALAVELLRGGLPNADADRLLDTIDTSASRATEMVRQILTFARGVEGRQMGVQLPHLIADLRRIALDTFPRNIQSRVHLPANIWSVKGDPTQLYQVVLNLCLNARDAMPQGGVLTVDLQNVELDAQYAAMNPEAKTGPYVVITVTDTGIGMSEEVKQRLFEPFFTTKEVGRGTGLGLSVSLGIVRNHGGFIQIQSQPHKGSTFKVHLPAVVASQDAGSPRGVEPLPHGHGELVLLVDDEAAVRVICKQTLEACGFRVLTANHGAEAVALFAQEGPAIAAVLMDLVMPVMDGWATMQALASLNPLVKVIAMSGHTPSGTAPGSLPNLKAVLTKPFTTAELVHTLIGVLRAEPAAAGPPALAPGRTPSV